MNYFITAIGTDSGKTLIAAALTKALKADYWKPIQAGFPTDSETVREFTNGEVYIHPEHIILETPASPHAAAAIENRQLKIKDIKLPVTNNNLIIEGAGGCMVPLSNQEMMIELAPYFNAEIVLISNNYLGSINHTLLTVNLIKSRGYSIKGIIFNGPANKATEDVILDYTKLTCIYKVPQLESIDYQVIDKLSQELRKSWNELD
ncbi:dethiobiotin synthase [Fulvivirga lutimaris]|uniref:dethiobiotin synthase n=1 Tax=Fulvivirga lutimaris TaxID=1819566 RepID=UPI0012BBE56D|nr:dethiobiotin synthase [Fulvivirga lutimaris]MTI39287.1 dethiobiotin synthase [Fulvivirga lutimaris]